jgi:A/G-specific adenine glycosylase
MLILLHEDRVMLEKRPLAGVWAGLWSLPEAAPGSDVIRFCEVEYGAKVEPLQPLPSFVHCFTHFALEIHPRRFRVCQRVPMVESPGCSWLPIREAIRAAIPSPVRRILASL